MVRFALPAVIATCAIVASPLAVRPVDAAPKPERTRGVITAINGDVVTVQTRFAGMVMVKLQPRTSYVGASKTTLADVKPGTFIGTAALPGPGGMLTAEEITVFPDSMRGAGEGHYAWDLGKSSTMTNGTIGTVSASDKFSMTVSYKGGEKKLAVPNNVPVVGVMVGGRSLVRVGAHVVALGAKEADGSVDAMGMIIGKGDTVPPM